MAKPGFVYFLRSDRGMAMEYYKIGITSRTPEVRMREIEQSVPFTLTLIDSAYCADPQDVEQGLLQEVSGCNQKGEWFHPRSTWRADVEKHVCRELAKVRAA